MILTKEPHPSGFEGFAITVQHNGKITTWSVRDFGGQKWAATYDRTPELKELYQITYRGWEGLSDTGEVIRGSKEEVLKHILKDDYMHE